MLNDILYNNDSVNVTLFHAINNIQMSCFQQAMGFASIVGKYALFPVYLVIITVFAWQYGNLVKTRDAGAYVIYVKKVKQLLISLIVAYAVYLVWVSGLKHLLHMPRPFAILPEGSVFIKERIKKAESPFVSFPSGHAAFSMMMLVALWPLLSKLERTIGALLVLCIGISRIALGVHFPSDIVTTWVISFIISWITVSCSRKLSGKWLGLVE